MKKLFIILALFMFSMNSMGQGVVTRQKSKAKSEVSTQNKKKTKNKQKGSNTTKPTIHAVDVPKRTTGIVGGYEYVDLGLPSGTLWATCNVGASKPEEYGDYFAWGETTGYNSGKTNFTWDTYKYCNGSYTTMTKYCTQSKYGTVDNKTVLEAEDDAATVNWGSNWRMPTIEECKELINSSYTTTEWTTLNGVKGRKITSKTNGNSIFLPAAGYRNDASLYYAGSYGYCWSSSLYSSSSYYARLLYFNSSVINAGYDDRFYGQSVRPVRQ